MEDIANLAIASLKDGKKMYSSYDVGKQLDRASGYLDTENFDYGSLFSTSFNKMNKAERIATFDAAAYTSRTFSMFGGETTPATLLVEESVMSAIIDRFGKDVESAPVDATHARVHVTVAASPVFFGWLAQFGTAVRLEAPSALARQYADYLRDIADSY